MRIRRVIESTVTTEIEESIIFASGVAAEFFGGECFEIEGGELVAATRVTRHHTTTKVTEYEENGNAKLREENMALRTAVGNHRVWLGILTLFVAFSVFGLIMLSVANAKDSVRHGNERVTTVEVEEGEIIIRDQLGKVIDRATLPKQEIAPMTPEATAPSAVSYQECIAALKEVITDYNMGDRLNVTRTICGSGR